MDKKILHLIAAAAAMVRALEKDMDDIPMELELRAVDRLDDLRDAVKAFEIEESPE